MVSYNTDMKYLKYHIADDTDSNICGSVWLSPVPTHSDIIYLSITKPKCSQFLLQSQRITLLFCPYTLSPSLHETLLGVYCSMKRDS